MRILEVNAGIFGSTGNIMLNIARESRKNGIEVYTASTSRLANGKTFQDHFYFENTSEFTAHRILGFATGMETSFSYFATRRLISYTKKIKPDIIHLHIMHGWYINLPMLFRFIRKTNIKIVWTMHDCWAFTGHCPHFCDIKCEKWKDGCERCEKYKEYPRTLFDNSKRMFLQKKKLYGDVKMAIVTPSAWLSNFVKKSFLMNNRIEVIHNGIDLTVFKPRKSSFRSTYGINDDDFVVLGVAFGWEYNKGLDVFIKIANQLSQENVRVVLVGTDENLDHELPDGIISIHKTENKEILADIYAASDLFVNPTRLDTFPTVNIESIACGTPVLTFCTGGSPEIIDSYSGSVVECDDVDALIKEILRIKRQKPYKSEDCVNRAKKEFDMQNTYQKYVNLYYSVLNEETVNEK